MKITKNWLESRRACSTSLDYVCKNGYIGLDIVPFLQKLINQKRLSDANWLITRYMNKDENVKYAIFAAKQVLPIFNKIFPKDNAPMKAIEAAKKYCKIKNTKFAAANTSYYTAAAAAASYAAVIAAASYAADAAAAASYAADAAAAAAASYAADAAAAASSSYVADAASYAADAADAAAVAAADAAAADDEAGANDIRINMLIKIIQNGIINILEE